MPTSAGGTGSPWSRHDSTICRVSFCAISATSTRLRPSATSPGTSGLVATKPPSARGSMCKRTADSLIGCYSVTVDACECIVPHGQGSVTNLRPKPIRNSRADWATCRCSVTNLRPKPAKTRCPWLQRCSAIGRRFTQWPVPPPSSQVRRNVATMGSRTSLPSGALKHFNSPYEHPMLFPQLWHR